ncbi:putative RNA 2'-phosphotransferase [Sporomusa rhizae]|uniref:RNA 2'-phosphotransferase n=1 Tax=Sporomusa rhizae TaxID=357999 RepID=UPI00352B12B2
MRNSKIDFMKLSKEVSYALRHAPWEYELELGEEGWVEIDQLLYSMNECREWYDLSEQDLHLMIEKSDKKRHEISDGKIRALYGHSLPQRIVKEEKEPPKILYHGTARRFLASIKVDGLLPKGRQYVHLSIDVDTASQVGKRRDNEPTIFEINARKAWGEGIKFYQGNDKVWLADFIPSKYVNEIDSKKM